MHQYSRVAASLPNIVTNFPSLVPSILAGE
jgi:hypothetical protein